MPDLSPIADLLLEVRKARQAWRKDKVVPIWWCSTMSI